MPLSLDLEVPRNGHYYQRWELADDAGVAIDLTGYSLEMDVRAAAGGASIASAEIEVDDAVNGSFLVKWTGADFDGVAGTSEIVRVAYDFRMTGPDSIAQIITRGQLILFPGVTS